VSDSGEIEVTLEGGDVVVLTIAQTKAAIKALLSDTMFAGSIAMAAQLQVALLSVGPLRDQKVIARAAESVALRRILPVAE
jgi:hypothetical protein